MTKFGRSLPKYPEDFKKAVVKEVMEGIERISWIADRHGIAVRSIYRWLDRYGSGFCSTLDSNQVQKQMSKLPEKKKKKKHAPNKSPSTKELDSKRRF